MIHLLLLAATLAEVNPYPTPATAPTEALVRRAPVVFPAWPEAAVIENSGSTNLAGYRIAVRPDGSAAYTTAGGVEHGTVSRATTHWLFAKLEAAGPLPDLAVRSCMKSASFGSTLTLEWRGARTPDLSCGGGPMAAELSRTAAAIVAQLHIRPGPRRVRPL